MPRTSNWAFFTPGNEQPFTLSRGPKELGITYWSLWRYARYGRKGLDGAVVRLEVCLLPGGLGTTLEAYARFIARLNGATA
jgi:hypothetical protein